MKKSMNISIALATLLMAGGVAFAGSDGLKDSVAKEEAKALKNPTEVNGTAAAKAKVEEATSKEQFEAKMKASDFSSEARADRSKRLQRVFNTEVSQHKGINEQTPKMILEGIGLTVKAAKAIKSGKNDEAAKYLEKASKDFAEALKKNPALDMVPVNQEVKIKTFAGDINVIKKALDMAKDLIEKHQTQDAREILIPLQDEMDFIVRYIPMKIYPDITKKAAEALKQGKSKEALVILAKGFGTIMAIKQIIPIPLMLAQDMVIEASKMDKTKKDEIIKILESAKMELKRAELLGYTQKHTKAYQTLTNQINAIEDEIKGKNAVEKLYEDIKMKFSKLFEDIRKDK